MRVAGTLRKGGVWFTVPERASGIHPTVYNPVEQRGRQRNRRDRLCQTTLPQTTLTSKWTLSLFHFILPEILNGGREMFYVAYIIIKKVYKKVFSPFREVMQTAYLTSNIIVVWGKIKLII